MHALTQTHKHHMHTHARTHTHTHTHTINCTIVDHDEVLVVIKSTEVMLAKP